MIPAGLRRGKAWQQPADGVVSPSAVGGAGQREYSPGAHMNNAHRTMGKSAIGRVLFGKLGVCAALLAAFLGLAALGGATSAVAQINPFGKEGGNLTKEDWEQINAAKAKALTDPAAVGTKESWENPKSGNSGTIDITKEFKRGDLPCRTVKYTLTLKGQKKQRSYVMNECKAPDGRWKFI